MDTALSIYAQYCVVLVSLLYYEFVIEYTRRKVTEGKLARVMEYNENSELMYRLVLFIVPNVTKYMSYDSFYIELL